MSPDLSIPVLWVENGGQPLAGRLDLLNDRIHLEGGSRADRRTRDVAFAEIASVRLARDSGHRIAGRAAIVLSLVGGGLLSLVGFERPGTQTELLHLLEAVLAL
jgi:hypothetical protein